MIRRDHRNIGKRVHVAVDSHPYSGRTGVVMGFRGDFSHRVPFVSVRFGLQVIPVRGDWLEEQK